ncbi:acetyl-CoA carboxylase biotin carboxyl carrier protein [Ponticaulis sp.]|uniref:acetyl-CoA carboxylase biotin carboxyl carrier protein n=1 Tax=Ponticaulis sp. TaxID=2020902 RepID=UPI002639222E|nr:acetyl-CoA carboxylase biotin carboxyl carrier protein [Ponticaulis sp.]MDF1681350.1 acetyl-CoA carboxylase biotin carboxyl carrier protein [Ponticaulis sp.]
MANDKTTVDPALVRELAAILREADLGEIEVEQGELKIRVSKPAAPVVAQAPVSYAAPAAPAPAAAPAAEAASAAPVAAADEEIITSPMIGTFYRSPSPDASTFVEKGSSVNKASVVCIIEAMKVMNEIKAEVSGEIIEILVNDAEAVEYGQPLFKVKKG